MGGQTSTQNDVPENKHTGPPSGLKNITFEDSNVFHWANTKPFTFRWEIEQFPARLKNDGEYSGSRPFEVGDGVPMRLMIWRTKDENGIDSVAVYLCNGVPHKKVKLNFSGTIVNFLKEQFVWKAKSPIVFSGNRRWGFPLLNFTTLTDRWGGFLKDGHLLTLLLEGEAIYDEEVQNFDETGAPLDRTLSDKLSNDFGKLLDLGTFSDFELKAKDTDGKEKEFKVHKPILMFFAAMLSNPELKEYTEDLLDAEVMEALLRYIYTGSVLGSETYELLFLLVAAEKYETPELKTPLERVLAAKLSINDVCSVLHIADTQEAQFLVARCREFIRSNAKDVVMTEGWRELALHYDADFIMDLLK